MIVVAGTGVTNAVIWITDRMRVQATPPREPTIFGVSVFGLVEGLSYALFFSIFLGVTLSHLYGFLRMEWGSLNSLDSVYGANSAITGGVVDAPRVTPDGSNPDNLEIINLPFGSRPPVLPED